MPLVEEVEKRVARLEKLMEQVLIVQAKTQESINQLSLEMREFKDEMREFKDEMREFKDEMREFKDEMREFKNEMEKMGKEMNKRWGDLANKMGTLVEDLIIPNLPILIDKYFKLGKPDIIMPRVRQRRKIEGQKILEKEFDAILVYDNKKVVVLNETKSSTEEDYIRKFAEFIRSEIFFVFFPQYKDYRLIPIYSSVYINEEYVKLLTKEKILAVRIEGDILNFENFDDLKELYSI